MKNTARRWSILLVDDNYDVLEMNRTRLEREGFAVSSAYSGEECLELVAANAVDLILLDVTLPGITGFEVCKRIRAQGGLRQPNIIMLTGLREVVDKVTGLKMGADDYLTKPFDVPELLARVRAQLRIRELQEKLVQAEKLAIIGQMAITLSHKINNPLSTIIWQARLLQDDLKKLPNLPDHTLPGLEAIVRDAHRIEHVIKQVHHVTNLALTQYDGQTTMIDLDQSADDAPAPADASPSS
jgi:CheY-like chemotaxis protein